jgi:hypothetical protein
MIEQRNTITNRSTEFGLPTSEEEINAFSVENNIERRNIRNSLFKVQFENADVSVDFENVIPTVGSLIYSDGNAFYGDGNEFVQLAKNINVPTSAFVMTKDATHKVKANAISIPARDTVVIPNDFGNVVGSLNVYSNPNFYFDEKGIYTVTISFYAQPSNANAHADLYFGTLTAGVYSGCITVLNFLKGNNVAHGFSHTFQVVGDATTKANGLQIYIVPSHTTLLWQPIFTIQKVGYGE